MLCIGLQCDVMFCDVLQGLAHRSVSFVVHEPAKLAAECGTDLVAIEFEIQQLKRTATELDREIMQTQYVRGCRQVAVQTDGAATECMYSLHCVLPMWCAFHRMSRAVA